MKRVSILLADGFEEIEALAPLDILRRLNYDVELISMTNSLIVESSHGVGIKADKFYDLEIVNSNAIVIPGGLPGATNLRDDNRVISLVKKFYDDKKLVAAICAGPIVLGKANILTENEATSYPGFEDALKCKKYREDKVVVSNNVITSRGPATAFDFAFAIANYLGLDTSKLLEGMLFK